MSHNNNYNRTKGLYTEPINNLITSLKLEEYKNAK